MGTLGLIVSGNFAKVVTPVEQLPPKARRAMSEGLREGGDKVRTKVRKALKEQTNVKRYGAIVDRTKSFAAELEYTIRGSRKPLSIPEEIPTRGRAGKGAIRWSRRRHWQLQARQAGGRFGPLPDVPPEVTSRPWNVSHLFKRSFVGEQGMRAAIPADGGKWRFRKLFGPNVAKEIVKDRSLATFQAAIKTDVLPPIEKRLARVMSSF